MKMLNRLMSLALLAMGLTGSFAVSAATATCKGVITADDPTTMTLYYDAVTHEGTTYARGGATGYPGWKGKTAGVTKVVVDASMRDYAPTDKSFGYFFYGMSDLVSIEGLGNLDLSKGTWTYQMFYGCSSLVEADLSLCTIGSATSLEQMFQGCSAIETIYLPVFASVGSITSFEYMFRYCSKLKTIYAAPDTDLSGIAKGSYPFNGATAVVGGNGTVYKGQEKKYAIIDEPGQAGYFTLLQRRVSIDTAAFAAKHIASVAVTTVPDGEPVVPAEPGVYLVEHTTKVVIVYTPEAGYDFDGLSTFTDNRYAEIGVWSDATLAGDDIPTATLIPQDVTLTVRTTDFAANNIKGVFVKMAADGSVVEPMAGGTFSIRAKAGFTIFYQAVDGRYFLKESISDAGRILDSFYGNTDYLETGILSATTVTTCPAATETFADPLRGVATQDDPETLTLSWSNDSPVGTVYLRKSMTGYPTWHGNSSFKRVVIDPSMSAFGLEGNGFQYLFSGLSGVTNIEGLANLDTSHAKSFYQMFRECSALQSLDLQSFRTENVKDMGHMFYGCSALTELDISAFSSAGVTTCAEMFRGCSNLKTIFALPDFDLSALSSTWVFWSASKLVGGNGTKYDSAHGNTPEYGHIDEDGNPGYFTLKMQTLAVDTSDFDAKHIDSFVVTRVSDGSVVDPVEYGLYSIVKGERILVTYTAVDGYLFASGATFADASFAETGILTDVALTGDALPAGAQARKLTVATDEFETRHIAAVTLETGAGTVLDPVSVDPNVYEVAERAPFDVVFTAANGFCFSGIGRHQRVAYPSGITANGVFDSSRIAPTEAVKDAYVIRYFDGKDNHMTLRDAVYPYSETEPFALYDASSMAPVPNASSYARFVGWCENADRSDAPVMSLPPLTLGDKTFYAKYEIGKTDWLEAQAKAVATFTNWTGNVIAHATSDKVTAGAVYSVTMPYAILLPETFAPERTYPLVLYLHGAGSRGTQGQQIGTGIKYFYDYLRRRQIEAIIVAPQVPGASSVFSADGTLTASDFLSEQMRADVPGSNPKQIYGPSWVDEQWMPQRESYTMTATPTVWLQAALAIFDGVRTNVAYQVDADRIYVVGMSMGGYGTWDTLQRHPDLFAGAVPCCGGADTNRAATIKDIPIWANHGGKDTTVYTIRSQSAVAALRAAGSRSVRYTEYGDDYTVGEGACSNHNCWDMTFSRDDVMDWLFEQVRGTTHETVTWVGGVSDSWADAPNWLPHAPRAGDDVVINSATTVRLSAATPRFHSVTIGAAEGAATVEMSGWNTALWTDTLTVGANGVVTCAKGGETKESLSRVWLKGYEVTVAQGGRIDASGKGYWKAATGSAGIGAGPSAGSGAVGTAGATGAAHGGYGGAFGAPSPLPYDDLIDPDDAGSSGGLSATSEFVSAGGGVIRFELTGPLTVDGEVLANAEGTSKTDTADWANDETAGAGGSIVAEVANLTTSGANGVTGVLSANGGDSSCPYGLVSGRVGGGGRIALRYQTHIQKTSNLLDSRFPLSISVEHGLYRWIDGGVTKSLACVNIDDYGSQADIGTIWMADNKMMGGFGRGLNGELHNVVAWDDHSTQLTFGRGHARLTGDASIKLFNPGVSAGARLELGGGEPVNYAGGVRQRADASPIITMFRPVNTSFGIGANARLDIYAPKTEAAAEAAVIGTTGTTFTVNGTLRLWSDPETGVAPRICAKDFIGNGNSLISARNTGLAMDTGFGGGTIRIFAKTIDQKAGSVFSVAGGDGLLDITTWKVFDGPRLDTKTLPQSNRGQKFAGTIELGDGGRQLFSCYMKAATGVLLIVK